jgi:hypothetical protein
LCGHVLPQSRATRFRQMKMQQLLHADGFPNRLAESLC